MQQDQIDPNDDAMRQALLTRMGQRSPTTGINGGANVTPPAPPQPGPGATPPAPPAPAPAPTQPFDRTAFRDSINGAPDANAVLAKYGLTPDKAGRVTLPTGEIMDVVRGAGGGGTTGQWMGVGEMGANGQASMYAPSGGAAAGGSAGGGAFQDQIRQMLMQTMTSAGKPVDANDPQIKAEMEAQRNVLDRQALQQRAASAERNAFQGTLNGGQSSGGFDTELNGIQENEGQALTSLQSQLFSRVAQQKQAQLQQALQLAVQSGDAESARAIQMQIAQMDAQIKQQSLSQQQGQWNDQFGLSGAQFQYQKDRDKVNTGLGV